MILLILSISFKTFLCSNYMYHAIRSGDSVFIGTTGGLLIFYPHENSFKKITIDDGILGNDIVSLDTGCGVWLCCKGRGVSWVSSQIKNFTSFHGLISTNVTSIKYLGDSVLCGTDIGLWVWYLNRNDFNWYSDVKPSSNITCLAVHKDRLYCGTKAGLGIKIGDRWKTFEIGEINCIYVHQDTIYVGTDKNLYIFYDTTLVSQCVINVNSDFKINNLYYDTVLYICGSTGLYFYPSFESESLYEGYNITGVFPFSDTLYFITWGSGILKGEKKILPSGLPSNFSKYPRVDKKGNCWIVHAGGAKGKITRITPDGKVTVFDFSSYASGGGFNSIFIDAHNNLWVGNFDWDQNIGLIKIDTSFNVTVIEHGGSKIVSDISGKNDTIYFTTWETGIYKLLPSGETQLLNNTIAKPVEIRVDKNNRIYVITYSEGLWRINQTGEVYQIPLGSFVMTGLLVDSKNRLWVGTDRGIYVLVDEIVCDSFPSVVGYAFCEDAFGNIWCEVPEKGLCQIAPSGEVFYYGLDDGFCSVDISIEARGLDYDPYHGYLWACTRDGVSRVDIGKPLSEIKNKVLVFPNPAISQKDRSVNFLHKSLKGVKIFTLSGRKVCEIKAEDSRAVWDITKVSSGVYIYIAYTEDGVFKGKIFVVR